MPLKATIIFEGDTSVGQKDEVYTMELPYTEHEWESENDGVKDWIRNKIFDCYNFIHQDSICKVYLPGEKY